MTTTFASFLERLQQAAAVLDEQETISLVSTVQQQAGISRLRLLVIGSPGSGRFSLVNLLLGMPALLPVSPLPRAPIRASVSYGSATSAEVIGSEGIATSMPPERVREFLTNPGTDPTRYTGLTFAASADLLRTCDIRIETLSSSVPDAAWKEMLAGADYALLVLNATALLSGQERRFIRDLLRPAFGLERVAVVINQMDLVAEDERAQLAAHVRAFLGPFERQPMLLELSAAPALAGLQSGDVPADSGYAKLRHLVYNDLIEQHRTLKTMSLRQAAEVCMAALEEGAQRQQALLATSADDLRRTLHRLDPHSEWVQERVQRVQQRIEAFINTLVKEQSLRDVEDFNRALAEQLPDELAQAGDTKTIRQHLPGYIETLWREFFSYHLDMLRADLTEELNGISRLIENDLRELIGEAPPGLQDALLRFDPTPASMKAFMMPSRGNHPAGTAATWMQLGGIFLLVVNPQISLILVGVGQVVRMAFQKPISTADRQAVINSLAEAATDLERQLKHQVGQQFRTLTSELQQTAADTYTQSIMRMRTAMEEQLARQADLETRRAQIEQLAGETLPALRQELALLVAAMEEQT